MIFPKNFLNFRFDTVEKQSILNLNSYSSKSYASIVLDDSEFTFLREREDAAFHDCILFIYGVEKSMK